MPTKISSGTLKRKESLQVTAYPTGLNHSITGKLVVVKDEFRVYAGQNYHIIADGEEISIPSNNGKNIKRYKVQL